MANAKQGLLEAQRAYLDEMFGVKDHPDIRRIEAAYHGDFEIRDAVGGDAGEQYFHQVLTRAGEPIASNDPAELEHHSHFLQRAHGCILLSGLGCGALLHDLLGNPNVEHITVVEKERDIIDLVTDSFCISWKDGDIVTVVEGDIFEYSTDGEFDCIYHDIWPSKPPDDQQDILEQRFGQIAGWHGFAHVKRSGGAPDGWHGKPGRSGRPRAESPRNIRKGVRFTEPEYEMLTQAAQVSRENESSIIQRGTVTEAQRILNAVDGNSVKK